jgi:hypothetical protein
VVEHDLAKVGVEGSNPFARSRIFELAKFDEGPLSQRAFRFLESRRVFAMAAMAADAQQACNCTASAGMKTRASSLHRSKIRVIHGWISRHPGCRSAAHQTQKSSQLKSGRRNSFSN